MTAPADRSLLGAAIAAGLTLYALAAKRRERDLGVIERAANVDLGHEPEGPEQITAQGWWDISKRFMSDIGQDNLSLMAAGIAFYALLALTPAITALVAIYGLAFAPTQVEAQVASMASVIPAEARTLIAEQLSTIVQHSSSALGIGLLVSLAIAAWSATSATSALMSALNVVYAEREKRSVLRYYASALGLTGALVLLSLVSLVLVAVTPAVIGLLPLGDWDRTLIEWSRWPVLLVLSTLGLAIVYRYAPSRNEPRWSWVSSGAAAATVLWLLSSALFSLYVGKFASYNKIYGSLAAVVVLLMWFWVSAFAVLLGAELNAEMEHQRARDTTRRPKKPLGKRGAFVADTVAPHG